MTQPRLASHLHVRLDHGYHPTTQGERFTIGEGAQAEVLDRLLELDQARFAAEVAAGTHGGSGRKAKRGRTGTGGGQMAMFGEE